MIIDPVASMSPDTFPEILPARRLELITEYGGFGIKTAAFIKAKEYVMKYTGELISVSRKCR